MPHHPMVALVRVILDGEYELMPAAEVEHAGTGTAVVALYRNTVIVGATTIAGSDRATIKASTIIAAMTMALQIPTLRRQRHSKPRKK